MKPGCLASACSIFRICPIDRCDIGAAEERCDPTDNFHTTASGIASGVATQLESRYRALRPESVLDCDRTIGTRAGRLVVSVSIDILIPEILGQG